MLKTTIRRKSLYPSLIKGAPIHDTAALETALKAASLGSDAYFPRIEDVQDAAGYAEIMLTETGLAKTHRVGSQAIFHAPGRDSNPAFFEGLKLVFRHDNAQGDWRIAGIERLAGSPDLTMSLTLNLSPWRVEYIEKRGGIYKAPTFIVPRSTSKPIEAAPTPHFRAPKPTVKAKPEILHYHMADSLPKPKAAKPAPVADDNAAKRLKAIRAVLDIGKEFPETAGKAFSLAHMIAAHEAA